MIIANPIYDVVFKYLLEDLEIARELLSTILGEELVSVSLTPQETVSQSPAGDLTLFRVDFSALIQTREGFNKQVLIEIQKAKHSYDIGRFRRYLGENYRKVSVLQYEGDDFVVTPPEIVTIYFLGFELDEIPVAVLKTNRKCTDAVTGAELDVRAEFVRLLTHESFTIQIPRLETGQQTKLERILEIFSQKYQTSDPHQLDFKRVDADPLLQKILSRLSRAIASEDMRRSMEMEDEIEGLLRREKRKIQRELEEERKEKENALLALEKERTEKEALLRQIEALQKRLEKP